MVRWKLFLVVIIFLSFYGEANQSTINPKYKVEKFTMWSDEVKDSFTVYVSSYSNQGGKYLKAVYYLDATLNSGFYMRKELLNSNNPQLNSIYIGIAHIGDYHIKRRRDFIPPPFDSLATQNLNFAQGEKFYKFLTKKLIPTLNAKYKMKPENSLIGHSLGGLFTIYALTRNESVFSKYYSLSPSAWINYYDIIKCIDKDKSKFGDHKTLVLMKGGLEFFNKINTGNQLLNNSLTKHQKGLKLTTKSFQMKGHNGYVNEAIKWILLQ